MPAGGAVVAAGFDLPCSSGWGDTEIDHSATPEPAELRPAHRHRQDIDISLDGAALVESYESRR